MMTMMMIMDSDAVAVADDDDHHHDDENDACVSSSLSTCSGLSDVELRQAADGKWYTQEEFREYYKERATIKWRQAGKNGRRFDASVCDDLNRDASEHTADSDRGPNPSEHTADSNTVVERGVLELTQYLTTHGGTDPPPSSAPPSIPPSPKPPLPDPPGHMTDSENVIDRGASEHTANLTTHGGTDPPPSSAPPSIPPMPERPPPHLPTSRGAPEHVIMCTGSLMGVDDIPELKRNCHLSRKALHAEARALLNHLAVHRVEGVTCLVTEWKHWKEYVACHRDGVRLVGPGIVAVTGQHIEGTKDPNRSGAPRFDFVAPPGWRLRPNTSRHDGENGC